MTARQEAIRRLQQDTSPLPEGEPFTVDFYRPEDGYGVARLMYTVYGDGHPIDTYYIPEQLTDANKSRRVISVVARTESGQIVCHEAFYRSSAPNPDLYELGMGLTLPAYRGSLAFARCSNLLLSLLENGTIKAIFGEAVCNHTTTQKMVQRLGFVESGIELDLMPGDTYQKEQPAAGRVSCLMAFRVDHDPERPLCIPDCYTEQISFMMEGFKLKRLLTQPATPPLPSVSMLETERFSSAGVCRCSITATGSDLAVRLAELEQELRSQEYSLLQCFVPLGTATAAATVDILRACGFFLGGFLPAWFGDDGLLMQKLFSEPCFDAINLHSERSRTLLELVRTDWQRSRKG